jgi:hypothetical protein
MDHDVWPHLLTRLLDIVPSGTDGVAGHDIVRITVSMDIIVMYFMERNSVELMHPNVKNFFHFIS